MTSANGEITYRQAGPADYDAVMAIGQIYGGRDYLWSLYKQLITDPDKYGLIAEVGGVVAGFYMTSTFDEGQTVLKRCARVHKNFQGRGIFHKLEAELDKHTLAHRPKAKYDTFANTEREDHLAGEFLEKGFKPVYRKEMYNMLYKLPCRRPVGTESHSENHCKEVPMQALNNDDLRLLFRTESVARKLFPKGRLLNTYMCYRLLDDNIRHIICERGGAFASLEQSHNASERSNGSTAAKELGIANESSASNGSAIINGLAAINGSATASVPGTINGARIANGSGTTNGSTKTNNRLPHEAAPTKNHNNNNSSNSISSHVGLCNGVRARLDQDSLCRVAMVTFYYCYPTPTGFLYYLDVYARPEVSRDHFRTHLKRNLEVLQKHFPNQDGVFTVAFDPNVPREHVVSCLTNVGIVEELEGQERWQVLYERDRSAAQESTL